MKDEEFDSDEKVRDEKIKKLLPLLAIPAIFAVAFLIGNYRSKREANTFTCKFNEITMETVNSIAGGDSFDKKTVQRLNEETPYCSDLCKEELNSAKKHPDEWYITNENRELCKKVGIILPQ